MKEQNTLVKYTRSEIDTLPDETDWERVDALTDEDIDAAASSDPDAPPTDASFWKDATVVMPENMEEYTQRRIREKISEIEEKSASGNYIYRGEPKIHEKPPYCGKISSSLWRKITKSLWEEQVNTARIDIEFVQTSMLLVVQNYIEEIAEDEFGIMAELQHYGGATNLIDFTTDYFNALFFACDGSSGEDGRIILLQQNEAIKDWIKEPRNPRHRVIAQKSVFVRPPKGFIEPREARIVTIPATLKQPLLEHLQKYHGISTEKIYNDLHGFIKHQGIHQRAYIDFYIGLSHVFLGEFDHAITAFTKAIELNPNFAAAYNNLGLVYGKKGDYAQAIEMLDKAIELNPNYADAYSNRGIVSSFKGDNAHAIEMLDKAIELNPNHADAYSNRGSAYRQIGNYISAIVDLDKAIELNPKFADAYYNRGVVSRDQGEVQRAIADYTRAIELNPNFADVYYNRGVIYNNQGEVDLAIADYTRAIELNPNFADVYYNRGVIYNNQGEVDLAIADHTKAIEFNPNHADAYNSRGIAYRQIGRLTRAIADFDRSIELNPNDASAYNNRGGSYYNKGNYDCAIKDLNRAIELNPNFAEVYNNRSLAYHKKGEFARAIKDCERTIELNPNFAEAYNNRAAAQRELENSGKQ